MPSESFTINITNTSTDGTRTVVVEQLSEDDEVAGTIKPDGSYQPLYPLPDRPTPQRLPEWAQTVFRSITDLIRRINPNIVNTTQSWTGGTRNGIIGLLESLIPSAEAAELPRIANRVNEDFLAANNWVAPRRDPLVLDLDGGGIATTGIAANNPILFDQDGDGLLVATGWIGSGEAIVVRDLNGNGTIDSGRELFGDNTILTRGPSIGQIAANGFDALADLDADADGIADGKFDINDVAFDSVRLWRDLNQDAISQSNELFTFSQLGVGSIEVSGTASNIDLGVCRTFDSCRSFGGRGYPTQSLRSNHESLSR